MHLFSSKNSFTKAKFAKKILILALISVLFELFGYPYHILSARAETSNICYDSINNANICENISYFATGTGESTDILFKNILPDNKDAIKVVSGGTRVITAYNSEPGQTDDNPCITANGFNLCKNNKEDSIAANFLPFGTKVRIPDLFGEKVFIVRDRMHPRFKDRVDVWMVNKTDALKFGRQLAKIEVIKD